MNAKRVDGSGRILLGKRYAGAIVLVERQDKGVFLVRPLPLDEAWLWRNKKALSMVLDGLREARRRRFVTSPNLAQGAKLAARIGN